MSPTPTRDPRHEHQRSLASPRSPRRPPAGPRHRPALLQSGAGHAARRGRRDRRTRSPPIVGPRRSDRHGLGQDAGRLHRPPGFIVNRVNRPFTIEALRILEAGAAGVSEIDEALRDGGFPMGPFELMDLVGIDVNLAAATGSGRRLGRPDRLRPSPIQEALVAAGHLGRKTGQGFYRYEDGRPARGGGGTAGVRLGRAPRRRDDPKRILDAIVSEARSPPRKASPRPTSSTSRCDSAPATRMGRSSLDSRWPRPTAMTRLAATIDP